MARSLDERVFEKFDLSRDPLRRHRSAHIVDFLGAIGVYVFKFKDSF